jgi:hypothetical protein
VVRCSGQLPLPLVPRQANLRIKSLSGASSQGFTRVRPAGQNPRVYPGELGRTAVNCNPNCNPGELVIILLQARNLIIQQW